MTAEENREARELLVQFQAEGDAETTTAVAQDEDLAPAVRAWAELQLERDDAVGQLFQLKASRDATIQAVLVELEQARTAMRELAKQRERLAQEHAVALALVKEISQRLADRVRAAREDFVRAEAPDVMVLAKARQLVEQSAPQNAPTTEDDNAADEDA